jgi:hypothetical protein
VTATSLDPILDRLARGLLARSGGFLVVSLLGHEPLARLAAEAHEACAHAETFRTDRHDGEEHRGGAPDRWLESAVGGDELARLYTSPALAERLQDMTGLSWVPSGGNGTYSYYRRGGHYLGLHRDVEECDLAVIVCVSDRYTGDPGIAGTLCVYPQRAREPLSAIRATPERDALYIRVRPGEAAVLLGGIVPHRVVPVEPGHERVVAPLCFSATGVS